MENTLKQALVVAGNILMDNFGKIKNIQEKESQSNIVTQADLSSEQAIIGIIRENFPDHNILAEESGFRFGGSDYTWIIDPLDGTSNFSAGLSWFGILICVLKNSQPLMAGISLPYYKIEYFVEKGKGAKRNEQLIAVSSEKLLKNVLFSYSLDYCKNEEKSYQEASLFRALVQQVRNIRSTNSVLDLCYTADGRLGGCINQTTKIWDIAAPSLLLKEAGGIVSDINGQNLDFSLTENNYARNFTFVGTNQFLYPPVMKTIKACLA